MNRKLAIYISPTMIGKGKQAMNEGVILESLHKLPRTWCVSCIMTMEVPDA